MAIRIRALSLDCPLSSPEASTAAKAKYRSMVKAAGVAASFFEGDLAMKIRKRVIVKKKAIKRAISRKRR